MIDCRDILDAVFINVRGSFIDKFYSSIVKSRTLKESSSVDEDLTRNTTSEPILVTEDNVREAVGETTETVREEVERSMDEDIMLDIRLELEERMPYALASACASLAMLDRKYREIRGEGEQPSFSEFYLEVGDDFPLSERFVFPCVMFVSSMMLLDIDEDKSDSFYEKYALSVTQIVSEMPFEGKGIVERYPY